MWRLRKRAWLKGRLIPSRRLCFFNVFRLFLDGGWLLFFKGGWYLLGWLRLVVVVVVVEVVEVVVDAAEEDDGAWRFLDTQRSTCLVSSFTALQAACITAGSTFVASLEASLYSWSAVKRAKMD